MNAITIKNVRCFVEPQPAPIAPLTLLVGENSTGKSTFLAMTRIVVSLLGKPGTANFNEEPFFLRSYNDIANYRGGRWRAPSFHVGLTTELPAAVREGIGKDAPSEASFTAGFSSGETEPVLTEWSLSAGQWGIRVALGQDRSPTDVRMATPKRTVQLSDPELRYFPPLDRSLGLSMRMAFVRGYGSKASLAPDELEPLLEISDHLIRAYKARPHATAPVRSKPRRTYDPLSTEPDPEGGHVVMVLASALEEGKRGGKQLAQALDSFGEASGLFKAVKVKKLGKDVGTPFQIRFNFGTGPDFNLIDVGYGVSQALPIAVDIIRSPEGSTLLIQQPEVHMHPRAQAALGSLLVNMAKAKNKRFLVETHSDYLVDRVRMEIRENAHLSPDDVQILYFHREDDGRVEISPLELDEQGNILNAPPGYREFFLREEERFLGV